MLRLDKVIKPWKESAALNDHINLYGFWNETTFLTKSGDVGMVLSISGVDYESLDRSEQEYAVKRLEAALKVFGPSFHVYAALRTQKKNALPKIAELLTCYRAFKEGRNSFAHQNGLATQTAVDAYQAYHHLSASDLDVTEKPTLPQVLLNTPIAFSLRGVIGFADIILRTIATLDAEFSCSQFAVQEFRAQWIEFYSVNGKVPRRMLKSAGANRREKQLTKMVNRLKLPRPSQTSKIDDFLKQQNFII